jgi:hypothetical protein
MSWRKGHGKRTAMNIKVGDTFKNFSDEKVFSVKKIVNNWVVLESPDRKEQILTGVNNLEENSFYLKKENKEL